MDKLATVIETLCSRKELEPRHRDHALTGDWKNWRDCHIEPDWLLLYSTTGVQLILARTGTHSEIFG